LELAEALAVALDDPVVGTKLGAGEAGSNVQPLRAPWNCWNASGAGVSTSHHTISYIPYSYLNGKHCSAPARRPLRPQVTARRLTDAQPLPLIGRAAVGSWVHQPVTPSAGSSNTPVSVRRTATSQPRCIADHRDQTL
jgi:hypothetical protein